MLVDATFRYAMRNFSTLFLFIAVVIAPLHIAHAFIFRSVYQLGDIDLARAVDVGVLDAGRLQALRISSAVIAAIELGLLPLLARGARSVIARDDAGEVPRVIDALAGTFGASERLERPSGGRAVAAVAVLAVGAVAGLAAAVAGRVVVELLPDSVRFVGIAAAQIAARAAGATFVVALLALALAPVGAKEGVGRAPTS